jgi:hypothetical protein
MIEKIALHHAEVSHELGSHFQRQDRLHTPLYVVTPVFNAVRYRSRWTHYQDYAKRVAEAGGVLITVEAAFGGRDFVVTEPGNPQHVQVRVSSELWLKENLINRGVARLSEIHPDWPKVAWIDADVNFERDDIMDETRHALEHYDVVQMWSHAQDMGPDYIPLPDVAHSYGWCFLNGIPRPENVLAGNPYYYQVQGVRGIYWHPGYAWACTREWWDGVGGLIDWTIIGNGDYYMAEGMSNRLNPLEKTYLFKTPSVAYDQMLVQWQTRCMRVLGKGNRGGLGVVPGLVTHKWHGKKMDRQYDTRWKLLIDTGFDPTKHLKRDRQLIWTLDESAPVLLRDGLRRVARLRNEDSIDL